MRHHLHLDHDDHGHQVVHCLRCGVQGHGVFPAEPCPAPDVAVLCCAEDSGVVVTLDDGEGGGAT